MARLTIAALTNETRGSRFMEFRSGDHFHFAGTYTVDVDDDLMGTPEGWAIVDEAMFAIGNRQRPDANGTSPPPIRPSEYAGRAEHPARRTPGTPPVLGVPPCQAAGKRNTDSRP